MCCIMAGMEEETGSLSARLRQLRERRGWSIADLARLSGVSYNHIYKLERGSRRQAGADILAALAKALETTVDYLTGKTDDWQSVSSEKIVPTPDIADLVARLNQLPAAVRASIAAIVDSILELTGYGEITMHDPQLQADVDRLRWLWPHLSPERQAYWEARIAAELAALEGSHDQSPQADDPAAQTVNG